MNREGLLRLARLAGEKFELLPEDVEILYHVLYYSFLSALSLRFGDNRIRERVLQDGCLLILDPTRSPGQRLKDASRLKESNRRLLREDPDYDPQISGMKLLSEWSPGVKNLEVSAILLYRLLEEYLPPEIEIAGTEEDDDMEVVVEIAESYLAHEKQRAIQCYVLECMRIGGVPC